jgi:site-specific DNA recombinase
MKKKAVILTRVSTDKQVREGVSLDAQQERCEKYAELQDWEVVSVYTEEGVSGGKRTDERDVLKDALATVKKHKGVLVVYSLSRLSRNLISTLEIVEDLSKSKSDLASVSENIDTAGPCGRFQLNVMASFCALEREQTGQRTKLALNHLKEQGKRYSLHAPYGYKYVEGEVVRNKDEQEVIKYVKKLKKDRYTYKEIQIRLELKGYRNRKGNRFHMTTLVRMVKNED